MDDIEFPVRHRLRVEQQVKIVGGKLTIGRPKGGKNRAVSLLETAAVELAEHLRRYPAEAGQLLFRTPSTSRSTATTSTPTSGDRHCC